MSSIAQLLKTQNWSLCPDIDKKVDYLKRRYKADNYIHRPDVRYEVFARDNFKCVACGSTESLTLDHIISVYAGGSPDDNSNLQTLCNRCNSGKLP